MSLNKRELLLALAALGASAAIPATAQTGELDLSAARAVGEAYRAAHPDDDLAELRAALPRSGVTPAALSRLRAAAADDFRAGRIFAHQGWRLSRTEGRLFALLAT
jgi:hypothetical protein